MELFQFSFESPLLDFCLFLWKSTDGFFQFSLNRQLMDVFQLSCQSPLIWTFHHFPFNGLCFFNALGRFHFNSAFHLSNTISIFRIMVPLDFSQLGRFLETVCAWKAPLRTSLDALSPGLVWASLGSSRTNAVWRAGGMGWLLSSN